MTATSAVSIVGAMAAVLVFAWGVGRAGDLHDRNRAAADSIFWLSVIAAVGLMVVVAFLPPLDGLERLEVCAADGGVQMVLLEGEWQCVTAEQAG